MARVYEYNSYGRYGNGRITNLKWIAVVLMVGAVVLFLLAIVILVLQMQAFTEGEYDALAIRYPDAGSLIGSIEIFVHTSAAIVLIVTVSAA